MATSTLTLQTATAASWDTGWTQSAGDAWTSTSLVLTVTGAGSVDLELSCRDDDSTTVLYKQTVPWTASGTLTVPLPTPFYGQIRLRGSIQAGGTVAVAISGELPKLTRSPDGSLVADGAVVADTSAYIDLVKHGAFADGVTPSDDAMTSAVAEHTATGKPILLPSFPIVLNKPFAANAIVGADPFRSRILIGADQEAPVWLTHFIRNRHFTLEYNANSDNVRYENFTIDITPSRSGGVAGLGLANVIGGFVRGVTIIARRNINSGTGKPYTVDPLLDFYACCKNVRVSNCVFQNITGGYGTTVTGEGGGGCIWVRNIRDGAASKLVDITENIVIEDSDITHWTSDEAVAFFGVRGIVHDCHMRRCRVIGLESGTGPNQPFHSALLSAFPLADGSPKSVDAAVYECSFEDCDVYDSSCFYNVIRFGNTPDAAKPCWGNTSRNNRIKSSQSSDATYGPHAIWIAGGSQSTDPTLAYAPLRNIDGTQGTGYPGSTSLNRSIGDKVEKLSGLTIPNGWNGWDTVESPTFQSDVYTPFTNCKRVFNARGTCSGPVFVNCTEVDGGKVNMTLAGSPIFSMSANYIYRFIVRNVEFGSAGNMASITNAVQASATVSIQGCHGATGNAAAAAISNNAPGGTIVRVQNNVVTGSMNASSSGTGTTTKSGNYWSNGTDGAVVPDFPAPVNSILISAGMTLQDYAPTTLNPSGGAAFRGGLITKLPHGRTHTRVQLLIGASSANEPDQYRVAWSQGEWGNFPGAWNEFAYPGGLAYCKPATPSGQFDLTGVWLDSAIAPVGYDTPVGWSIEAAGLGRWTAGVNASRLSWPTSQLAHNDKMDPAGTLTGAFSETYDVNMGLVAWGFDVSGAPIYNIATVGDSTWSGIRPLGSANELGLEGSFHYANLDEIGNGMRWITSNWGNGAYTMDQYLARGRSLFPLLQGKAQILAVQAWTYNQSPSSTAAAEAQQAQLLAFKADAEAAGFRVIFGIINPQGDARINAGWNEGYDAMVAWLATQPGGFNVAGVLADPGNPRRFLNSYAEDQVHANAAAVVAQGPVLSGALTASLLAIGAAL